MNSLQNCRLSDSFPSPRKNLQGIVTTVYSATGPVTPAWRKIVSRNQGAPRTFLVPPPIIREDNVARFHRDIRFTGFILGSVVPYQWNIQGLFVRTSSHQNCHGLLTCSPKMDGIHQSSKTLVEQPRIVPSNSWIWNYEYTSSTEKYTKGSVDIEWSRTRIVYYIVGLPVDLRKNMQHSHIAGFSDSSSTILY